jgi:antitoxin component of MazEF toxin-antitoxin module
MKQMIEPMKEKAFLRKIGSSSALILSKGALKVYNLKYGDAVEVDYKYPKIILKKWEDTKEGESDDKKE